MCNWSTSNENVKIVFPFMVSLFLLFNMSFRYDRLKAMRYLGKGREDFNEDCDIDFVPDNSVRFVHWYLFCAS